MLYASKNNVENNNPSTVCYTVHLHPRSHVINCYPTAIHPNHLNAMCQMGSCCTCTSCWPSPASVQMFSFVSGGFGCTLHSPAQFSGEFQKTPKDVATSGEVITVPPPVTPTVPQTVSDCTSDFIRLFLRLYLRLYP